MADPKIGAGETGISGLDGGWRAWLARTHSTPALRSLAQDRLGEGTPPRVVIAGGHHFAGHVLCKNLLRQGHRTRIGRDCR